MTKLNEVEECVCMHPKFWYNRLTRFTKFVNSEGSNGRPLGGGLLI